MLKPQKQTNAHSAGTLRNNRNNGNASQLLTCLLNARKLYEPSERRNRARSFPRSHVPT